MFRLTLVAGPHPLSPAHLARVEHVLDDLGLRPAGDPGWLAHGQAATIPLLDAAGPTHLAYLRKVLAPDQIDVFGSPFDHAPLKLLLIDMDSTLLQGETLDDLAARAGVREAVSAITAAAMNGTMDYRAALAARLNLIKDKITSADLKAVLQAQRATPGAATLIATCRANGIKTVLVSGGFTFFTEPVAAALGINHHHGNMLDLDDQGRLTGRVMDPLIHHARKLELLKLYQDQAGLRPDQTAATGDGANDIPMMQATPWGVAYRPKPAVAEIIANQILYGDLTSLLYAWGMTDDQIVRTPDPVFLP